MARRYASRRLLQSVLFILGVALGVAVIIAIDLANASATRAFRLSTESVTGQATHQVLGGANGLPTDVYRQLRLEQDLRLSAPVVEGYVPTVTFDGLPLRVLGVDPLAEAPFRNYLTNASVDGADGNATDALNAFVARPRSALISQTLADRFGVGIGDVITLQPGTQQADITIVGLLLPNDDVSAQALEDLILMDIATAQTLIAEPGRISRIDLILPENADLPALAAALPDGVRLAPVTEGDSTLAQMTEAFDINLQALSLLALVVGAFLIYNTVTFNVVQRRPVIGTLRSLGMTRRQIFGLVLSEAILLTLIGVILGLALGVIMGRGAVALVSQAVNNLYLTVNVNRITVAPWSLMKGALIGIGISTAAAIIPSWDATRTPPAGVLRRSTIEDQTVQLLPYITAAAIVLNLLGVGLLMLPTQSIWLSFIALFCIVVGSALFTPPLLVLVMRWITPLMTRVFGILGRMAPRAVSRSLSRTSVAVAALTVAVSVIVGVSVMISSFRNTVADWLDTTLGADIYVSAPLLTSTRATTGMDPQLRELVRGVTGITQVSAARSTTVTSPDYPDMPPVNLTATDFDISGGARRFVWNNTPNNDYEAALADGGVMVSEPFAYRRNITPQDNTITLDTDNGPHTFEIFGVFYDYSTDQGTVFLSMDTYHRYWDDRQISSIAAYTDDPAAIPGIIDQLETETLRGLQVQVQSNRALRQGVFEVFDQAFSITVALRLLATVVAFIGILSALLALQLENTRQYGLMRAIGLTPAQLGRFTLLQTGLMGFVAGLLALPIGLALAAVLIFVINIRSFGWSMAFIPLPGQMLQAFAVALGAALIAGLYPAWRLGKLVTAKALRSE
jgi:putative ABC transport system permease protein